MGPNHQITGSPWRPREFCVGATTFRSAVPRSFADFETDPCGNATRSSRCHKCSNQRRWWTSSAELEWFGFNLGQAWHVVSATSPLLNSWIRGTWFIWFLWQRTSYMIQQKCPKKPCKVGKTSIDDPFGNGYPSISSLILEVSILYKEYGQSWLPNMVPVTMFRKGILVQSQRV